MKLQDSVKAALARASAMIAMPLHTEAYDLLDDMASELHAADLSDTARVYLLIDAVTLLCASLESFMPCIEVSGGATQPGSFFVSGPRTVH